MNKKQRTAKCREILNSGISLVEDKADFDFLIESFMMLPHWHAKVKGQKVMRIEIGRAPAPKAYTKCFYIVREDGSRTDYSFYPSNKSKDVKRACRSAIAPIVQEYIEKYTFPCHSELSGTIIESRNDADVDHYDLTFDEVANKWIALKGGKDYLFSFVNETKDNESETCFTSKELIEDFINFHNANTHLRVVTKFENRAELKRKEPNKTKL